MPRAFTRVHRSALSREVFASSARDARVWAIDDCGFGFDGGDGKESDDIISHHGIERPIDDV